MKGKEKYTILEEEGDSESLGSKAAKPTTQIGIVIENVPAQIPPMSLEPATSPPIQPVQITIVKSRAVEQIQEMLHKRRKKNKKNWKQNTVVQAVVLLAVAGILFTIVGIILHIKFSSKILWSIPAYLWLYLAAVYIFSIILTGPLARALVTVWKFSFFYENYIYYYTHGTVRGLHILLAAGFPWIYWTYFASQSIHETGNKTDFQNNTQWVPRVYLSLIVIGTSMIGKQIIVRILAGKMQANNYREHVRAVLFLEKVLSHLSGKNLSQSLTVTHADLLNSIKNVEKGGSALPPVGEKRKNPAPIYEMFLKYIPFIKGVGIRTPKIPRPRRLKTPEALATAAENMSRKIFARLDTSETGYLTVENFKKTILDEQLARSTFEIFDRNGDAYVSQQELSTVIEEVYMHRRTLQHSLKDTKNLEKSLEEIVTSVFVVIGFMGLLTVFGVDVQASLLSFSVIFFSLGFALGPFLQALIFSIIMIFFVKPFDVGDRISVGSDKEILIVESIGLWVTDTLDGSGKRHYLHNGNLAKDHIVNHTRTSRVDISIELSLSLNTSKAVLNTIKESLLEWVRSDPELYSQSPSVQVSNVAVEKNMVTVSVSCELRCSWFDPRRGQAKQEFINLIHSLIQELGLTYTPPQQTLKVEKEIKKEK